MYLCGSMREQILRGQETSQGCTGGNDETRAQTQGLDPYSLCCFNDPLEPARALPTTESATGAGSSSPLVFGAQLCAIPSLGVRSLFACVQHHGHYTDARVARGLCQNNSKGDETLSTHQASIGLQSFPAAKYSMKGDSGTGLTSRDCRF